MDPKLKEILEKVQPAIEIALKNLPQGFSRDTALSKCQEATWWIFKAFEDEAAMNKGTPVEAPQN